MGKFVKFIPLRESHPSHTILWVDQLKFLKRNFIKLFKID